MLKSDQLHQALIEAAREVHQMVTPVYDESDRYSHWTLNITIQGQCKRDGELTIIYTMDDSGYHVATKADEMWDVVTEYMRRKGFNLSHEPRKITALPAPEAKSDDIEDGEFTILESNKDSL